jgi:predicted nucleotidyltransferase
MPTSLHNRPVPNDTQLNVEKIARNWEEKDTAIKAAQEYASVVKQRWECDQVILFGSYAKGTFHKDSDIDIAVVMKDYDSFFDTQLELMKLRRGIDSRIEPHPFRTNEFGLSNPLVSEVVKYGFLI